MFSKEQFELKMRHVCERKLCDARGREQTFKHNLLKTRQQNQEKSRYIRVQQPDRKVNRKSTFDVRPTMKFTSPYTPSTTRKDIDQILKDKGIHLGTRQRPTTTIRVESNNNPKNVKNVPENVTISFVQHNFYTLRYQSMTTTFLLHEKWDHEFRFSMDTVFYNDSFSKQTSGESNVTMVQSNDSPTNNWTSWNLVTNKTIVNRMLLKKSLCPILL